LAPSADPRERLKQLLILKDAYKRLTPSEPFFPHVARFSRRSWQPEQSSKPFPHKGSNRQHARAAQEKEALLRQEEANLHDANLITVSIESRIEKLRAQKLAKSQQTSFASSQQHDSCKAEEKARL